jgi:hypothetical protein
MDHLISLVDENWWFEGKTEPEWAVPVDGDVSISCSPTLKVEMGTDGCARIRSIIRIAHSLFLLEGRGGSVNYGDAGMIEIELRPLNQEDLFEMAENLEEQIESLCRTRQGEPWLKEAVSQMKHAAQKLRKLLPVV